MMTNKRNMVLETIGLLFLVTRSDFLRPRRATSECNEHTFGMWRMILREFNMEQLMRISEKSNIWMNAMFESNLVASRYNGAFKGYQMTFPEFLSSMQAQSDGATPGLIDVDLQSPAVNQLWNEVEGVITLVNSWMIALLKLFGADEGNGVSPFAVAINLPSELLALVNRFFVHPKEIREALPVLLKRTRMRSTWTWRMMVTMTRTRIEVK